MAQQEKTLVIIKPDGVNRGIAGEIIEIGEKVKNFKNSSQGTTIQGVTKSQLININIPNPPLKIQKQIVSQIEKEQQLVNANKELITTFERKIKDRIARIWGEES